MKLWVLALLSVAAVAEDVTRRKISNWIPVAALFFGLLLWSWGAGWSGVLSAVLGTAAGGSVFLIFYLLGGMGGGDIKLMAGFGAILGPRGILEAALWTAGCGGILAAAVLLFHMFPPWNRRKRPASIPYAPAIAAGVWLSLAPRA